MLPQNIFSTTKFLNSFGSKNYLGKEKFWVCNKVIKRFFLRKFFSENFLGKCLKKQKMLQFFSVNIPFYKLSTLYTSSKLQLVHLCTNCFSKFWNRYHHGTKCHSDSYQLRAPWCILNLVI